jgi:hypothetical protein
MERESSPTPPRRRQAGADAGTDELGLDDEEFASIEDTGPEPSENAAVDDV